MEKDWLVVISGGDINLLSRLNANCTTIDLICNLAAPLLAGQLIYFTSTLVAAISVAVWNVVSAVFELLLLLRIHKSYHKLSEKKSIQAEENNPGSQGTRGAWLSFVRHPVREAGVGLAFLYMTVLGFDSITWGYCLLQGVTESTLGIATAISSGVGVLGARLFPIVRKRIGLEKTGMIAFTILSACLTLCVASIWSPGSPFDLSSNSSNVSLLKPTYSYISVALLLTGIITGKVGLWMADLTVQQVFQETVEQSIRGVTNDQYAEAHKFDNDDIRISWWGAEWATKCYGSA